MYFKSLSDLSNLIIKEISRIPHDIDLVVGIPRSGLLVAIQIALLLNKPCTDLDGLLENRILAYGRTKSINGFIESVSQCRKILVVDDSVASGESIRAAKSKISQKGISAEVLYLAAYVLDSSKDCVDIFLEVLPSPRLFEWNVFHQSAYMAKACLDIDGVICDDPTYKQNDDGKEYLKFIETSKPKIIPSCELGYIVTSRLEKYRVQTEKWLQDNHVKYKQLVMLDTTAEERAEQGMHGEFKAAFYKSCDAALFVESEKNQAIIISNSTGKPVFCLENSMFYPGDKKYEIANETGFKLKELLKKSKLVRTIYRKIKGRV